jgi:hypothetical protein
LLEAKTIRFTPFLPCGLVEVVRPLDVGLEDLVERRFEGDAREVDDRVDPAYRLAQGRLVGEVGGDRVRLALDGRDVEQTEFVAVRGQQAAHQGAESAGCAGEQDGTGSGHGRISSSALK